MMSIPGMRAHAADQQHEQDVRGDGLARGVGARESGPCGSVRKVHDFLTVGAAAPLQAAGVVALGLPETYYTEVADHYRDRRDKMAAMLARADSVLDSQRRLLHHGRHQWHEAWRRCRVREGLD